MVLILKDSHKVYSRNTASLLPERVSQWYVTFPQIKSLVIKENLS